MGKVIQWNSSEQDEQEAVMKWAAHHTGRYPELELLFHIPNGGKRDKFVAFQLKRAGVKAGVPDLCLPVARDGYHGLFIELKYGRNTTTTKQDGWLEQLHEQGYMAVTCWGWQEAVDVLKDYLGIDE